MSSIMKWTGWLSWLLHKHNKKKGSKILTSLVDGAQHSKSFRFWQHVPLWLSIYVHKCERKGKILRRISPETIISPSHTSSSQMMLFISRNFSLYPRCLNDSENWFSGKRQEIHLKAKLLFGKFKRSSEVWLIQRVIRFSSSKFDILDGFIKFKFGKVLSEKSSKLPHSTTHFVLFLFVFIILRVLESRSD